MQTVINKDVRIDNKRLDVAMAAAGVKTDKALDSLSGVDERTIRNVRRNGKASFEVWNKLATALDCNPIDLLVTEGYPDPKWAALVALSV